MKQYILHLLIGFLLICCGSSCIKWDLDYIGLNSFNLSNAGINIGYHPKSDLLQRADNTYISVGMNTAASLLVSFYTEQGNLSKQLNEIRPGAGHRILSHPMEEDQFLVLGTEQKESFLITIDTLGDIIHNHSYFDIVNQQIGLLENISLYDMTLLDDDGILITGALQQSIGEQRMVLIKTDIDGSFQWIKTYTENTFGTSIKTMSDHVAVSGFKNDNSWIAYLAIDGQLIWEKSFSNTQLMAFNSIETIGDSLIYLANTGISDNNNIVNVISIKTNQDIRFNNTYSNIGSAAYAITKDRNDNLIIGAVNDDIGIAEMQLISIQASGALNWINSYTSTSGSTPSVVSQTNDFGYILFGITGDTLNANYHFTKTDEEGVFR